MNRVRLSLGVILVAFLVFAPSGSASKAKGQDVQLHRQRVSTLVVYAATGEVSVADSYFNHGMAVEVAKAIQRTSQSRVEIFKSDLEYADAAPGKIFVLLIRPGGEENSVAPISYVSSDNARSAALSYPSGGTSTWVIVSPSRLWPEKEISGVQKLSMRSLSAKFGLAGELFAQIVLDGTVNSVVTLPTAVRSGDFQSPDVQFTSQFENITFTLFLPVDADWLNSANTIDFRIEYSPDRSVGSWTYMCGSYATYGTGRPLDKHGVPSTGGSTSCSNRDPAGYVLRPVTTWYHMIAAIPNPMTIGAEVRIPAQ